MPMTFRHRQYLGWGVIAVAVLLGGGWLARLDYSKKISSDVLDLIPSDERAPELTLVRSLSSQAEARTMFFVLTGANGKSAPAGAATRFAAELAHEPSFDQALPMADMATRDALGRELFEQRFTLLFPRWLRERETAFAATGGASETFSAWLAVDTTKALGRFLATPEALAFQEIIPADPLLLLPRAVDQFSGDLTPKQTAASPALVWARLAESPLSEAGQGPAFAAIERALAATRTEFPGLTVNFTGVNRFAAASRARIEHEITWLNGLSLLAVLTVAFVFIRGVHRGLHLLPPVLLSILGAWVCVTLVFDRVHILVFVVGSLLTGVAIDYGFYLYLQPPLRLEEDYWDKVRRLAKPLLASCLTTVAGFALLLFSELPFIRQLGVFVGAGLICALAGAVVYFSTVRKPFLKTREFSGGKMLSLGKRSGLRRLLIVFWVFALFGLLKLTWKDDIRELDVPSEELKQNDARIRGLFGDQEGRTVYITYGASVGEARASLEKFEIWVKVAGGGRTQTLGLGSVIPTVVEQARAIRFVHEQELFPQKLRVALAAADFDESEFAPFFTAYAGYAAGAKASDYDDAISALQAKLAGPVGLLLHIGQPLNWLVTLASEAPSVAPPADTHTVSAGQLQTLNRLFSRYRQSALWLSLAGLAIVGAGVLLSYGWRDGWRIFAIPCGACLGLFGLFGWIGHPLNLFHLLGAFLGVCLTHNYSIFTATSAYRGESPPVSVRLSALTAAASFGVLALSRIPVVHALGATVALMVITALLLIEFEHLALLGKKS